MSGTVRALTGTCPVKEWSKHMRRLLGVDKDCFTLGDTALLVCETAKALQSLGFTVPRHDLHLLPVFMTELAAPAEPHCYPCWQLHHRICGVSFSLSWPAQMERSGFCGHPRIAFCKGSCRIHALLRLAAVDSVGHGRCRTTSLLRVGSTGRQQPLFRHRPHLSVLSISLGHHRRHLLACKETHLPLARSTSLHPLSLFSLTLVIPTSCRRRRSKGT